jgi:S-formylglutathione hydrolase FrmB
MAGMVAMSAAMMAFAVLAPLAIVPVAGVVVARLARGVPERGVLVSCLVFLGCLVVLFIGGRHFGNGWPGTGGYPWAGGFVRVGGREWVGRGLVPGGFAAFSWAATLSVSTYWLHPSALTGLPAAEIYWMADSPLLLVGAIWAAVTAVRRVCLPPRILAFQVRLAALAILAMLVFFAGCGCWVASGGGQGLYRAGTIDLATPLGPTVSGTFYSAARERVVGYSIGYPPGYHHGDELPLVVMLHGFGGDHLTALSGLTPSQAVALRGALPPMALVTVDGGNGYWNPHPGDDPMGMLVNELIPRCAAIGLGPGGRIGAMGISMGGYGALLLAEKQPSLVRAVAAISPAIWTSYAQARTANAGAYASAEAFAAADAVTHAGALAGMPVRVATGFSDPFYPGVRALAARLAAGSVVDLTKGCHDGPFFASQEPASLQFLARHLA